MAQQTVPVSHFLESSLLAALLQYLVNARALTVAGPKAKAQAASPAVAAVTPLESVCTTSTKPSVAPLLRLLRRYKAGFSTLIAMSAAKLILVKVFWQTSGRTASCPCVEQLCELASALGGKSH